MKKIFTSLFHKRREADSQEEVMKIAKAISPEIDNLASDIFKEFNSRLLTEPITYIVPAVWGAKKDGSLTEEQRKIHTMVLPVIQNIIRLFHIKNLTLSQEFALGYLIRGLIISKITYMIEKIKTETTNVENQVFNGIETIGNA
jgi:hypothetical protein